MNFRFSLIGNYMLAALMLGQVALSDDFTCFVPSAKDYNLIKRSNKIVYNENGISTNLREICYDLQMLHEVGLGGYDVQCGKKYFTASLRLLPGFFKTLEPKDDTFEVSFEPAYSVEDRKARFRPIIVKAKAVKKGEPVMFEASICVRSDDYDLESDPLKTVAYVQIPNDQIPVDVQELPNPPNPPPSQVTITADNNQG